MAGEAFGRMGNYEFWMSLKPNSFKKCKQRREEDAALTGSIVLDVLKENSVAGGEPDGVGCRECIPHWSGRQCLDRLQVPR